MSFMKTQNRLRKQTVVACNAYTFDVGLQLIVQLKVRNNVRYPNISLYYFNQRVCAFRMIRVVVYHKTAV